MTQLLEELKWRGLIHDATPELDRRLGTGPITGYVGFDPTARSLQLGNLVPVMLLAHLQRAGGKPIILVGGGTGMIGDPSGKRSERPLLDDSEVAANVAKQSAQLEQFLEFSDASNSALVVDNAEWLRPIKLVDFLRETGKHFTISTMLQKESVKSRLDAGISFTEFSYMLLQAFDFLHLYREHGCELQLGGSDQWGNITAGVELIRRAVAGEAHGLCAPLITMSSGAKFGKTEQGSVWLDPEMTSPYKFFQFWINADDRDVESYLKTFTFRSRADIESLMAEHEDGRGKRVPQQALALDMTGRVHGAETAERVARAAKIMFGQADVQSADADAWHTLSTELPCWNTTLAAFPETLVELCFAAGLVSSKTEARRQLKQGGIYLNGERAGSETSVGTDRLLAGGYFWLRRGKKTDVIVKVAETS